MGLERWGGENERCCSLEITGACAEVFTSGERRSGAPFSEHDLPHLLVDCHHPIQSYRCTTT